MSSICVCMMMIIATCEWCVSSIFIYISTYAKHYNTPKLCVGPKMMRNRYADDERMKRYSFLLYPILNNSQQMSFSIRFRPSLTHSERERAMRWEKNALTYWNGPTHWPKWPLIFDLSIFLTPKMHTIQHAPHTMTSIYLSLLAIYGVTQWNRKWANGENSRNEKATKFNANSDEPLMGISVFVIFMPVRFSMMKCHPFWARTRSLHIRTCQ